MFILGILSLVQITFLPGALLVKLFKFRGSLIHTIVTVFGLSLLANYVIVALLTLMKLYTQIIILPLFAIEVIALCWLYRAELGTPLGKALSGWWQSFNRMIQGFLPTADENTTADITKILSKVVTIIFAVLAVTSIYVIGKYFLYNLGTIFNAWDAVVAWNQRAIVWSSNQIPLQTWRYPQLIPINWSLTYVFMNNPDIQFFAKALMPIFPLFIGLMIFDMGLERKTAGAFIGVVLTQLMMKKFLAEEFSNGYVDVAVSFFAFLVIYTLLKATFSSEADFRSRSLWLGGLFVAGAAVTKQAGVFILVLFPILAFLLIIKPFYRPVPRHVWKKLLLVVLMAMLIAAPWYIYKEITFLQGTDVAEMNIITTDSAAAYGNLPLPNQMLAALFSLGKYFWVLVLLIPALLILESPYRWITILVIVPIALIWSVVASYDHRNLSVIFPLMGLTAGMVFQGIMDLGLSLLGRLKFPRWKVFIILPVLLLLLVVALNFKYPASLLEERQSTLQRQIFSPSKNEKIYALIEAAGPDTKILTNYPVRLLPGLENNQDEFMFYDYQNFLDAIQNPRLVYILVPDYAIDPIHDYIDEKLAEGTFEIIFDDDEWVPYRMIKVH